MFQTWNVVVLQTFRLWVPWLTATTLHIVHNTLKRKIWKFEMMSLSFNGYLSLYICYVYVLVFHRYTCTVKLYFYFFPLFSLIHNRFVWFLKLKKYLWEKKNKINLIFILLEQSIWIWNLIWSPGAAFNHSVFLHCRVNSELCVFYFNFLLSVHRNSSLILEVFGISFCGLMLKHGFCFNSGINLFILQWELYSSFSRTLFFQSQLINRPFWLFLW